MKTATLKLSAVLAATMSAFAMSALADPLVITFENNEGVSGWSATDASITEGSNPTGNYAVDGATHAKSLAIAGETSRTLTDDVTNANIIDLLVRTLKPSADPTADDVGDNAQFAIASKADGKLCVYCKAASDASEASFVSLGDTVYTDGTWVRLTVNVTYGTPSTFTVSVNGTATGTTYYTLNNATAIGTVVVKGDGTGIDDFVARNGTSTEPMKASTLVDAEGNPVIVPPEYYVNNNVPTSTGADVQVTGATLTIAQAYQAGVAPTDEFKVSDATVNSASTLTLTFPGTWPADSYKVKFATTSNFENATVAEPTTSEKVDGNNVATFNLGDFSGNVLYYKVIR